MNTTTSSKSATLVTSPESSIQNPASRSRSSNHESTNLQPATCNLQLSPADPFPAFTQPSVLETIGPVRVAKFLDGFSDDFKAVKIPLPTPESANGDYFHSVAALFASPARLPDRLRTALLTLEVAASPESAERLDIAIQQRIPCVSINRNCALDCALELWFAAPDELSQFAPPAMPAGPLPPAGAPESSLSLDPNPDQKSQIEIQKCVGLQPSTCNFQPPSSPTDTESFAALARLSPSEYDRARRAEAKRLRLRIETLDTEVAKCRAELNLEAQANAIQLPAIEPWPEPVNGAEALDQVSSRYSLYLVLPPGAADAMSLWTTHAHALAAFHLSPRLSLYSPEPGCGKTTAFDVLTTMLPRPLRTENVRTAVLFRLVDQHQPALLLDEVDAYLPQSEELRGLLNAGHKRGACAYRCEGEGNAVRAFRAFAPAALAGIGSLPATLRDRSVLIPLVQAEEGQIAARFDPQRTDTEKTLARKLARWASDNFDALAACDPPLPPGAFNRLADNWRPLLAVAQIAGGDWPARALAAFSLLTAGAATMQRRSPSPGGEGRGEGELSGSVVTPTSHVPDSQALRLLADIRTVFTKSGRDRISSRDLAAALATLDVRPETSDLTPQLSTPQLSTHQLGRMLSVLGIHARVLRINGRCVRGYQLADFHDAFTRYLTNDSAS